MKKAIGHHFYIITHAGYDSDGNAIKGGPYESGGLAGTPCTKLKEAQVYIKSSEALQDSEWIRHNTKARNARVVRVTVRPKVCNHVCPNGQYTCERETGHQELHTGRMHTGRKRSWFSGPVKATNVVQPETKGRATYEELVSIFDDDYGQDTERDCAIAGVLAVADRVRKEPGILERIVASDIQGIGMYRQKNGNFTIEIRKCGDVRYKWNREECNPSEVSTTVIRLAELDVSKKAKKLSHG